MRVPLAPPPRPAGARCGGGVMTIVIPSWLLTLAHIAGVGLLVLLVFLGVVMVYMIVTWQWR